MSTFGRFADISSASTKSVSLPQFPDSRRRRFFGGGLLKPFAEGVNSERI
jgi:hypothetical protein